jgi:hypothetical protein
MSKLGKGIPGNHDALDKGLWERHGMELLGPPLTF